MDFMPIFSFSLSFSAQIKDNLHPTSLCEQHLTGQGLGHAAAAAGCPAQRGGAASGWEPPEPAVAQRLVPETGACQRPRSCSGPPAAAADGPVRVQQAGAAGGPARVSSAPRSACAAHERRGQPPRTTRASAQTPIPALAGGESLFQRTDPPGAPRARDEQEGRGRFRPRAPPSGPAHPSGGPGCSVRGPSAWGHAWARQAPEWAEPPQQRCGPSSAPFLLSAAPASARAVGARARRPRGLWPALPALPRRTLSECGAPGLGRVPLPCPARLASGS